jgi:hypothetical protein
LTGGVSVPPALNGAVARYFGERGFIIAHIDPQPKRLPAEVLADTFNTTAEVTALACEARLTDHLAIVAGELLEGIALRGWCLFLARFLRARTAHSGLAVLLLTSLGATRFENVPHLAWNGRLRRVDVAIWADLHAPLDRPEPLGTLAAALAVDLCGWRLDLAAEIARARRQDLLDPFGWLRLRAEHAAALPCRLSGEEMACPLALSEQGRDDEIRARIWKAQLTALFPWLEQHRQRVIDRHRKLLRVDDRLRDLGVREVDDLELGTLAWQLRNRVGRAEADLLDGLGTLRNDLAHHRVVKPGSLDRALREAQQFET